MERDAPRSLFVCAAFCFLLFACLTIGASLEAVNREISIEGRWLVDDGEAPRSLLPRL